LFIVLVAVVIFSGIQSYEYKNARKGPGPQVPEKLIDSPARTIEGVQEGGAESPIAPVGEDTDDVASATDLQGDEASVACTADAQICPDGSAVGRTGPDCAFSECPAQTITVSKFCTDAQKNAEICTMEYAPVCGLVQVQCVTTPCDPVPQTFGNACGACAQGTVSSYTVGECSL